MSCQQPHPRKPCQIYHWKYTTHRKLLTLTSQEKHDQSQKKTTHVSQNEEFDQMCSFAQENDKQTKHSTTIEIHLESPDQEAPTNQDLVKRENRSPMPPPGVITTINGPTTPKTNTGEIYRET